MKDFSGVAFLTSLLAGATLTGVAVVLARLLNVGEHFMATFRHIPRDVTGADMAACQSASVVRGSGSWGAAYRNYVIRCMQDKGYQAGAGG